MPTEPVPEPVRREVPPGVHALTAIHGAGSLACVLLSVGSAASEGFRRGLARTEGSRLMVELFGAGTWLFLGGIAVVLGTLAYGSWNLRPYAWPLTLAVYAVGVLGSLWEVSIGINAAWISAAVNAGVVAYALRPRVRRAYGWERPDERVGRPN